DILANPQRAFHHWIAQQHMKVQDSWGWAKEQTQGEDSKIYALFRVPEADVAAFAALSGREGFFIDPPRWTTFPAFSVQWAEKEVKETDLEFLQRVRAVESKFGVVVGRRGLGKRIARDANQAIPRTWLLEHAPFDWGSVQASKAVSTIFENVTMLRQQRTRWAPVRAKPQAQTIRTNGSWSLLPPRDPFAETTKVAQAASQDDAEEVSATDASMEASSKQAPSEGKEAKRESTSKGKGVAKRVCTETRDLPKGVEQQQAPTDGSCLFHAASAAIAHILKCEPEAHSVLRAKVVQHFKRNSSRYEAMWDKELPDRSQGNSFQDYISAIAVVDTWAGPMELAALGRIYDIKFVIYPRSPDLEVCAVHVNQRKRVAALAFTGSHYEWLKPVSKLPQELCDVTTPPPQVPMRGGGKERSAKSFACRVGVDCLEPEVCMDRRATTGMDPQGRPYIRQPSIIKANSGGAVYWKCPLCEFGIPAQDAFSKSADAVTADKFAHCKAAHVKVTWTKFKALDRKQTLEKAAVTRRGRECIKRLSAAKGTELEGDALTHAKRGPPQEYPERARQNERERSAPYRHFDFQLATFIRIATLNTVGKGVSVVNEVSNFMDSHNLQICTVAEADITVASAPGYIRAWKLRGYQAALSVPEPSGICRVALISRVNFRDFKIAEGLAQHRCAAGLFEFRSHDKDRQFVIASFYGQSGNAPAAAAQAEDVLAACNHSNLPFIVAGDFNLEPNEAIIGEARATGVIKALDDASGGAPLPATGPARKRRIDYGLCHWSVAASSILHFDPAFSDHASVCYEVPLDVPPFHVGPRRSPINDDSRDIIAERFSQLDCTPFRAALDQGNIDDAWRLLSDWAEACLTSGSSEAVTLIRKKGGPTTRPITLTQIMWRIGAKFVARALRQWAPKWASESDHGGLPGRSISDVLFQVQAALNRGMTTAALMDVAGYFDAMNAKMLKKVFAHLGAPVQLAPLLESFYSGAFRYFCFEGSFDPEYHVVHSGIAQGCPLSPIAAAALSHCWSEYIKASCNNICVQIFMDDRTLMLEPSGSYQDLERAISASATFDAAFSLSLSPAKCFIASSRPSLQTAQLADRWGFSTCSHLELLGVCFDFEGKGTIPKFSLRKAVLRLRLLRWTQASTRARINLVRALIMPCLAWASGFAQPSRADLEAVRAEVRFLFSGGYGGDTATVAFFELLGWGLEPWHYLVL
ncbi:OTUD4, partial [Symbiodinium necroappetens]